MPSETSVWKAVLNRYADPANRPGVNDPVVGLLTAVEEEIEETLPMTAAYVNGHLENLSFEEWTRPILLTDGALAARGHHDGDESSWLYYLDETGLRTWFPGQRIRDPDESEELIKEDIEAERLVLDPVPLAETPVGRDYDE